MKPSRIQHAMKSSRGIRRLNVESYQTFRRLSTSSSVHVTSVASEIRFGAAERIFCGTHCVNTWRWTPRQSPKRRTLTKYLEVTTVCCLCSKGSSQLESDLPHWKNWQKNKISAFRHETLCPWSIWTKVLQKPVSNFTLKPFSNLKMEEAGPSESLVTTYQKKQISQNNHPSGGNSMHSHTLKMEAAGSSKFLVIYQTTRCHIPKNSNLHRHSRKALKSHKIIF
jgi:hypothetical protein